MRRSRREMKPLSLEAVLASAGAWSTDTGHARCGRICCRPSGGGASTSAWAASTHMGRNPAGSKASNCDHRRRRPRERSGPSPGAHRFRSRRWILKEWNAQPQSAPGFDGCDQRLSAALRGRDFAIALSPAGHRHSRSARARADKAHLRQFGHPAESSDRTPWQAAHGPSAIVYLRRRLSFVHRCQPAAKIADFQTSAKSPAASPPGKLQSCRSKQVQVLNE